MDEADVLTLRLLLDEALLKELRDSHQRLSEGLAPCNKTERQKAR